MVAAPLRARSAPVLAVLAFLCVGALFSRAVPAWEAPDEPWHVAYAEALAAGRLPSAEDTYEAHQPPLYYAWLAWAIDRLGITSVPRATDNPWFPYVAAALWHVPGDPGEPLLRALRAYSGLLGSLVVALAWTAGRAAFPRRSRVAGLAAIVVALWPQFAFVSHAISNDVLAATTGALLTYGLVVWMRRPAVPVRAAALLLAGGALVPLTKLNTVAVLVAAIPCAVLVVSSRARERPGRGDAAAAGGATVPTVGHALLPAAAAGFGAAAAVAFLGLAAPSVVVHLADQARSRGLAVMPDPIVIRDLLVRVSGLLTSSWARFGWLNVELAPLFARLGMVAVAAAVAAAAVATTRSRGAERRVLFALWTVVALTVAAAVRNLLSDPQPQGRLLFPALSAFGVLIAHGALAFAPDRRVGMAVVACVTMGLLAVDLRATRVDIPRAYETARGKHPAVDVRIMPPQRTVVVTLEPGDPVAVQTFRANRPDLGHAAVAVAWSVGVGTLHLTLRDGDREIARASARLPLYDRPAGRWVGVDLDPIPDSAGRDYALEVRLQADGPGSRVGLWGGTKDVYPEGRLAEGGEPLSDLVLVVLSGTGPFVSSPGGAASTAP